MLAEDVGRRAHLEVVYKVIIRDEVRVPVLDDVARVATEEEWLRRTAAAPARRVSHCRRHVLPQRENTLLREVPAFLVQGDVELDRSRLIDTFQLFSAYDVNRLAVVVNCRIREWRAHLWTKRQTVKYEPLRRCVLRHEGRGHKRWRTRACRPIGEERRPATSAKELHRHLFDVRSIFSKLIGSHRGEVFTPVKLIVLLITDGSARDDVSRQSTVHEATRSIRREIQRRVRCARAGDTGNEERETRILCHVLASWIGARTRSSVNNLSILNEHRRQHRGHGQRWHRHKSRRG